MKRRVASAWLCTVAASTAMACYEPAVREKVLVKIEPDATIRIEVDSTFKKGVGLQEREKEEIRRTLDLYALKRDPWLRGLERAGARDLVHERLGTDEAPELIRRKATLPSVESIVRAMPDAIANIKLESDDAHGELSLRIVHIDVPVSIRDNRRKLEKEVAALSEALWRLGEKQCDLYDYLAGRPERRLAVLEALVSPGKIDRLIDPAETVLVERFGEAVSAMDVWTGVSDSAVKETPAIATSSFSAFEHDFCVSLPADPIGVTGFVKEEVAGETIWCIERLEASDVIARAGPESDPPLSSLDGPIVNDEEALEALPFMCQRYEDDREAAWRLWEQILPRSYYELRWRAAAPAASAPTPPEP